MTGPGSQTAARRPRRRSPTRARQAVVLGLVAVAFGAALLVGLSLLASSGDVDLRLGDDRFAVGRAERLAERVEADRRPFLFSDVSGRAARDIYLQHLGETPEVGWLAFSALAPDQDDRACTLRWDVADQELVDPCSGGRFPADGTGLTRYPVEVADGQVYVELRPPSTTSAP